jgi:iron-sulfur cluster assembly protein
MIKVSDTASKKIIAMMQEDGFDAAQDYVRVGAVSYTHLRAHETN